MNAFSVGFRTRRCCWDGFRFLGFAPAPRGRPSFSPRSSTASSMSGISRWHEARTKVAQGWEHRLPRYSSSECSSPFWSTSEVSQRSHASKPCSQRHRPSRHPCPHPEHRTDRRSPVALRLIRALSPAGCSCARGAAERRQMAGHAFIRPVTVIPRPLTDGAARSTFTVYFTRCHAYGKSAAPRP